MKPAQTRRLSTWELFLFYNRLSIYDSGEARRMAEALAQAPLDETRAAELTEFGLLSPTEGWLRLDQRLYWTQSGDSQWLDITPTNRDGFDLQAVWFADTRTGWLVKQATR